MATSQEKWFTLLWKRLRYEHHVLTLIYSSVYIHEPHWQRHLERVADTPMSSPYGKYLLDARSPKERTIPTVTWPLQDSIIVSLFMQCIASTVCNYFCFLAQINEVLYYLREIGLQQKSYSLSWLTWQVLWPEVNAVVATNEMEKMCITAVCFSNTGNGCCTQWSILDTLGYSSKFIWHTKIPHSMSTNRSLQLKTVVMLSCIHASSDLFCDKLAAVLSSKEWLQSSNVYSLMISVSNLNLYCY